MIICTGYNAQAANNLISGGACSQARFPRVRVSMDPGDPVLRARAVVTRDSKLRFDKGFLRFLTKVK